MEHCVSDQTPCPKLTQYFSFILFFLFFFSLFLGGEATVLVQNKQNCFIPCSPLPGIWIWPGHKASFIHPGHHHSPQDGLPRNPKEQISPALPAARAAQFPSKQGNSCCVEVPSTSQPLITAPSVAGSEKFQPRILRTSHTLMFKGTKLSSLDLEIFYLRICGVCRRSVLGQKASVEIAAFIAARGCAKENLCSG